MRCTGVLRTFLRLISVPAINIKYKNPNSAIMSKRCSSCKKPIEPKREPKIISMGVVGSFKYFARKGEKIIMTDRVKMSVMLSVMCVCF